MYTLITPMGSSHPLIGFGQPPTRKEIFWLSETKVQDHRIQGDGLFVINSLIDWTGIYKKSDSMHLGNWWNSKFGTGYSGYILTHFAYHTVFIVSNFLLWLWFQALLSLVG
jgi:hypothetical protein